MYLSYIQGLPEDAPKNISATTIAEALQLNDVQVRKDLASVSSSGKPKVGYNVKDLIAELEAFLGYNDIDNAVIVGAPAASARRCSTTAVSRLTDST